MFTWAEEVAAVRLAVADAPHTSEKRPREACVWRLDISFVHRGLDVLTILVSVARQNIAFTRDGSR